MNPDRVLHLLKIMCLAKQWPQFQALHDIAREELIEANTKAQESLAGLARDRAEAKAANEVKLREKANAEVEEQEQIQNRAYAKTPTDDTTLDRRL